MSLWRCVYVCAAGVVVVAAAGDFVGGEQLLPVVVVVEAMELEQEQAIEQLC